MRPARAQPVPCAFTGDALDRARLIRRGRVRRRCRGQWQFLRALLEMAG